MKHLLWGSCISIILLTSCKAYRARYLTSDETWRTEHKYVESCLEQWHFYFLNAQDEAKIKLLYFCEKSAICMMKYPYFFIGVTQNNDTVGFVSKTLESKVSIGDSISFASIKTNQDTLNNDSIPFGYYPVFTVSNSREFNSIFCSVKNIYISKNTP